MTEYPIVSVPVDAANRSEPMGSKRKFWFGEPGKPRCLFKYNRPAHGEDWSEKIACEVANLLGLPRAQVDLAECGGERGIVTPDFCEGVGTLIHGNELLGQLLRDYPVRGQNFKVRQHTIQNVMDILDVSIVNFPGRVMGPPGVTDEAGVFVGYLMLDAPIGNTDRHHENWAIIARHARSEHEKVTELAPTFDHASSLGRELSDEERAARLDGRDRNRTVARYLARAESRLYRLESDSSPLSPLDAFREAASMVPAAGRAWVARLAMIEEVAPMRVVDPVPADRLSTRRGGLHGRSYS